MRFQLIVGPWQIVASLFCLLLCGWALTSVHSQDTGEDDEKRLRQIEQQLRLLQRSAEGMGPNHPQLRGVQQQISDLKEVQQQLEDRQGAWAEIGEDREANRHLIERLSDEELRLLVLKLSTTVKQLERRIERLERL